MNNLLIFLCFFFNNLNCFSQTENRCPCEYLSTTSEFRFQKSYQGKPCLQDFVKANIGDSTLINYVGKQVNYIKINNEYCDENKSIFTVEHELNKQSITILKSPFSMSEEKYDIDTIVLEGLDFDYYKRVSIEGYPFLGVQYHTNLLEGVMEKQNIVSEIKIQWDDQNISIPLDAHFLLFNTNFCKENSSGRIKPIEVYDIGNNKLAVYFHANPSYIYMNEADYIAKVIVDKNDGYIGTISMRNHDLRIYRWRRCKDFQGF